MRSVFCYQCGEYQGILIVCHRYPDGSRLYSPCRKGNEYVFELYPFFTSIEALKRAIDEKRVIV